MQRFSRARGFSLIELLVVVAIIGVLAGVGLVAYLAYMDSVAKDTSNNNLDKVSRALEIDITAAVNDVAGSSDLALERASIATSLTTPVHTVHPLSCEAFALSTVKQLNAADKNPFNKSFAAAAYGNIIQTDASGIVTGPAGYVHRRGTIVVSCNDPAGLMSDLSGVRLYQCVCTEDSDDLCRFSSNAETQAASAANQDPYAEGCPRPPITSTGFAPGATPERPIP